ncbi:MAG TPA: hypothetical protein VME63_01600 [Dyella sp.]|uniref:hypothetical protein n=1 Tax=Dyella sp. TaxID=1869338 RepID=UPI002D092EA8|nr:hypothetical protein [Dyella sp.]HTV84069.1 hypothetical protein [Dyella sp.]
MSDTDAGTPVAVSEPPSPTAPSMPKKEKGKAAVVTSIVIIFAVIGLIYFFRSSPRTVTTIFGVGVSLSSFAFSFSEHPRKSGWRIAFFILSLAAAAVGWLVIRIACPGI